MEAFIPSRPFVSVFFVKPQAASKPDRVLKPCVLANSVNLSLIVAIGENAL